MTNILVINAGSSSIKYQVVDMGSEERVAAGLIERIGEADIPDHMTAIDRMTRELASQGIRFDSGDISAVGHRVVMGGSEFTAPTLLSDEVVTNVSEWSDLAPLHNPGNLQAIAATRQSLPEVPQVAVFDTAFHQSMLPQAYTYAIDPTLAEQHGVRRYGFHGISHQVVARGAAKHLGQPLEVLKLIVLHLGNGASACAINRGESVDTSMGLTPLEGLVMGTRSGDLDPGAILHLLRRGLSADELDTELNTRSGLRGLAGSNDMRDVLAAVKRGDADARLALDVYVRRIRHYIGAYLAELDGADAIVFTAGIGENQPVVRSEVCADLAWFGIEIDEEMNRAGVAGARRISTKDSRVAVLVIPTDEETEIARQTGVVVGLGR